VKLFVLEATKRPTKELFLFKSRLSEINLALTTENRKLKTENRFKNGGFS
jgi:hypothetical protein